MAEVDQTSGATGVGHSHSSIVTIVDPPHPVLEEQPPTLSWCDESPPLEFDPELSKRPVFHCNESTKNSVGLGKNPSDDDLLQHINVSNILGEDDQTSEDITLDMTIPSDKVGLIIGRGGKTIKILQEKSGSRMNIIQASSSYEEYDKTLRLGPGPPDLVEHARQLVIDLLSKSPGYQFKHKNEYERSTGRSSTGGNRYNNNNNNNNNNDNSNNNNNFNNNNGRFKSIRFPVPKISVGLIIGKGGETIKRIRTETGAKIQFDPINASLGEMDDQSAVISGKPEQIRHACDLISELVDTAVNGMKKDGSGRGRHNNNKMNNYNNEDGPDHKAMDPQQQQQGQQHQMDNNNMNQQQCEEEERVNVPAGKVKLVIGKGRECIRNIIQQSGAQCEIDRNVPPDSIEKTFLVKGSRQQIDLAKEMILDKVNSRPSKRHPRGRGNGNQQRPSDNYGSNGEDYRNNEWGQGDPGTSDTYYDPSQQQQQQHHHHHHEHHFIASNPSNQDYGYSQWLEYFQPERQQAQADAWEQQVRAEQDSGDPQSLTLDSTGQQENPSHTHDDESGSGQAPPGFPPVQVHNPGQQQQPNMEDYSQHQNWVEQTVEDCGPVEGQEGQSMSDKHPESQDMDNFNKAQGDYPIINNLTSTDYEGLDPSQSHPQQQHRPPPGLGDLSQGQCPMIPNIHGEIPNLHHHIPGNPPPHPPPHPPPCFPAYPTFAYYYGHPVPQPAFVHPQVMTPSTPLPPPPGLPGPRISGGPPPAPGGSCTRIVTLFYDINCNSIVVLNQWHFS